MDKLNYCLDCKRVFIPAKQCSYCKSQNIKELTRKSPVNVIGHKTKGKILKIKKDTVQLLVKNANNDNIIKEYKAEELKKVL